MPRPHPTARRAGVATLLAAGALACPHVLAADTYQALDGRDADVIRWLDFATLDVNQVQAAAGQDFAFDVHSAEGVRATLSLNLLRGDLLATYHGRLSARPLPTWTGAASYRGSALGLELRYQPDTAARKPALRSGDGLMRLELSQLVLRSAAGHALQFALVAADAEETVPLDDTASELLAFRTDGGSWSNPVQLTPRYGDKPATVLADRSDPQRVVLTSTLPLLEEDYRASAWVHRSVNPTQVSVSLSTGGPLPGQERAQAAAFGVIAFIPRVSVHCSPSSLNDAPGQQATCTVTVGNAPQSDFAIALALTGDASRYSSDCASVAFAALQSHATCTVTATPNSVPGDGAAPIGIAVQTDATNPSWLVKGSAQTVTVQDDDIAGATGGVTPVPTLGEWGLALLGALAAGLGARRLRRRG